MPLHDHDNTVDFAGTVHRVRLVPVLLAEEVPSELGEAGAEEGLPNGEIKTLE